MPTKTKKAIRAELIALSRDAYGLSLAEFRARAEEISTFDVKVPGPSVLMRVASNVQPDKVRVLLELGVRPDADVLCAVAGGASGHVAAALEVFESLVDLVDVNVPDRFGSTPLIVATDTSNWTSGTRHRVVQRLLNAGADPNGSNEQGATPLHFAVSSRSAEVVRLLLDAGADRHATATGRSRNVITKGDTPISLAESLAEHTEDPRVKTILELLTDAG